MADNLSLDDQATQSGFARLVGASQPAIAKHYKAEVFTVGASYKVWLHEYCERLRTEAAGRQANEARNRRDMAQAVESEANAQLKMRELYKQDQLILDIESVRKAMVEWSTVGKNEFIGAVESIIIAIESQYAITVNREPLQSNIEAALKTIGGYEIEFTEAGEGSTPDLDTAA
ncbi:hypothetical protein ACJJIU_03615 [Microbulbifer sp. CnH-101-E]|uniref:hypothetical protein n=1 Tax=unclassified Microbulbifer TaxID=2619833 RepID=UPI00403A0FFA